MEHLKGGLADGMPDSAFNPKSLKEGMKVEAEHTQNPQQQKEIAKDHLKESGTYYEDLSHIEDPKQKVHMRLQRMREVLKRLHQMP